MDVSEAPGWGFGKMPPWNRAVIGVGIVADPSESALPIPN